MKKAYTKKQILEAIQYWQNCLDETKKDDAVKTLVDMARKICPDELEKTAGHLDEGMGKILGTAGALALAVCMIQKITAAAHETVQNDETPVVQKIDGFLEKLDKDLDKIDADLEKWRFETNDYVNRRDKAEKWKFDQIMNQK